MISIERLEEPEVLKNKKKKWLEKFIESGKKRPPSGQYAHSRIKEALGAMSFSKCFYCECKLGDGKDDRPEVDHHVEVAENRELAFEWTNLCLSCHGCNSKKLNNAQIPVSECLNPCSPSDKPADHLTFDDELIRPKNGSVKGSNTIKKYKLNREQLDYLRVRQIKNFERALRKLRERQVRDGRKELSKDEKEILESFKQPHHAFSLMFKVYLTHLDL